MKKLSSQQIRELWLNFFRSKSHVIEPGASLVPKNDPSLLWINSGVAALKKYFDGSEIPNSKRITNVQKSIRTNDIDNVGKTARHHTFFEMLGNFSIGDYFRKEAISFAYEILTSEKYLDLDINKLYFTYHPSDKETKQYWTELGVKEDHLIPLEGNYWQIGEGPCGPNTEVFYDRGIKYDKDNIGIDLLKNDIENDRYIEIWGIVFSQFNAEENVKREDYKELPSKNIDTGAGLERIACIVQETETNFETDLFMPYIKKTMELCKKPYEGVYLMPYRVIADHIRTCTFALADGAYFSNEGRGYVLRRLLRRAMRYGQKLGLNEPFLYKLVDVVCDNMSSFYPYLNEKADYIKKSIHNEEIKFIKTLTQGEQLLENILQDTTYLSGEDAFKLYDTYGFPIELTKEICEDRNVKVDLEKFSKLLTLQKETARNNRKNLESFNKQSKDLMEFSEKSEFIYDSEDIESKIIGIFKDGIKVESLNYEEEGDLIFDKTNFYAEMGGQISDTGVGINNNSSFIITDVIKAPNKQHLHHVKVENGIICLDDNFTLKIDKAKRSAIEKNHSATHLLQSALKQVLGNEIEQKGSFVNEKYLRFDFSYYGKIEKNQIKNIEEIVNKFINDSYSRRVDILSLEEAKKTDAICLFDEKYEDLVRVVSFGDVSKEFCGGTHVLNTKDIGIFKIVSEGSIASGIRRIEAKTSFEAYKYLNEKLDLLNSICLKLDLNSDKEIIKKIENINENYSSLLNKNTTLTNVLISNKSNEIISNINPDNIIVDYCRNFDKDSLMKLYDLLKSKLDNYIIVLIGDENDKHPLIVSISKDLVVNKLNAGKIIKVVCNLLGGSGGGRPDMAQGSILSLEELDKVLPTLKEFK
ncbi:MAG: alanine--tRNA ligase [Bacillales bacterium]